MKLNLLISALLLGQTSLCVATQVSQVSAEERSLGGKVGKDRTADVIIIGAGVSGIKTAYELIKKHDISDILILEARDEVGGRAQVAHLVDPKTKSTTTVEKGCNWIQGLRREPILKLAQKWGLKTAKTNYDDIAIFQGNRGLSASDASKPAGSWAGLLTLFQLSNRWDKIESRLHEAAKARRSKGLVDITVRAALGIMDVRSKAPIQKLLEWLYIDSIGCLPPETASLQGTFGSDDNAKDADMVIDQRGFRYIFEQELKEALNGNLKDARLRLGTKVTTIDSTGKGYDGKGTVVYTNQGTYRARKHVISTVSLGVLQNQDIRFTPDLPNWKKEAISVGTMGLFSKVFLRFEKQFWKDKQYVGYADPEVRGRYPFWANLNADGFLDGKQEGNVLFVMHVDQEARRISALSDKEVQAEAMLKLREMYGNEIPDPLDIFVTRWDQDDLFRGSYSTWPIGMLPQHAHNLRQPVHGNKIFFTGEANAFDTNGYVQGAWEQGTQTAELVANCIKTGQCKQDTVFGSLTTCAQKTLVQRKREMKRIVE